MDVETPQLEQAVRHHRVGQLVEADQLYQKILRVDPHHADALHLAGVVAHQLRRPRIAVEFISRAIAENENVAGFHANLGLAYRELGQTSDAVRSFREAIRIQPRYAGAHYNLGMSLEALNRLDEAAEAFRNALQFNPEFADASNNLGNVLLELGDEEAALAHFEQFAEQRADFAEAHFNLANVYTKLNRPFDALKSLEHAIELDPEHVDALNNLGLLNKDLGELDEAIVCFEKALGLQPDHADALTNLGTVSADRHDFDTAITTFEKALAIRPDDADIFCNLGFCWLQKSECQNAEDFLEMAVEVDSQCARAHLLLGRVALRRTLYEDACDHYRRGLELDPDNAEAWESLAKMELAAGRFAAGAAAFEESVSRRPDDAELRFETGSAWLLAGEFETARAAFVDAIRCQPNLAGAWNNLGNAWHADGRISKSRACYQRAVNIRGDFGGAHGNLAEMLRIEGRLDDADRHYARAIEYGNNARLQVLRATRLPPILESHTDIQERRARLSDNIDRLIEDGVTIDPAQADAPNIFYLAYQGLNDREILERYSRLFQSSHQPDFDSSARRPRHDDGKIHIGFVSNHFNNHTIGFFMRGLIRQLSRQRFHVTTFSIAPARDEVAREIERSSDEFCVLSESTPHALNVISAQKPDVLFYADLGMDPLTLSLAHSRLAPRQCATWGHPVTTGLSTIDEFYSSAAIEPDDADDHYTEQLVRLDGFPTYYLRPILPPKVADREHFGLKQSQRVYLCPQSVFKLHPDIDHIFGEILRQDPDAVVVLVRGLHKYWNHLLRERFARTISDVADRVVMLPRQDHANFMSLLNVADVMLDPLHFGGGNTSYQAMAFGIPVVTLPSGFMRGRATAGLYEYIGVTDTIACNTDDYIAKSLAIASHPDLRRDIHERILSTCDIVFENQQAVREIEAHLAETTE